MLKTDRAMALDVAMQKLLHYKRPSPPVLEATPEQIEKFADFTTWRKRLARNVGT